MTTTNSPTTPGPAPGRERGDAPRAAAPRRRARTTDRGLNRVFRWTATGAGGLILGVLAAVAIFLVLRAWPALTAGGDVLGEEVAWFPEGASLVSFVGPLVFGTLLAAALSLVLATPVAMGIALFISHYAPRRLASTLGYVVDLLAAIPSVVYGLWGSLVLPPVVVPVWSWLADTFGWLPLFAGPASPTGRVLLTVALVLAVMILPIITAVSREVFLQTPTLHEEAALALGATRWEMIRMAVLPFGAPGILSAGVLGLGRALGETMAVAMVLSATGGISFRLLTSENPSTIAANIALSFPEAFATNINVLIATGLILFIVTFAVNAIARWIIGRRKEFSGAN